MRKRVTALIAVAVALAWAAAASATGREVYVTYGEGANALPWWPHPTLTSLRCQLLYDRSHIGYGGNVTEFQLEKTDGEAAEFYNVKFYLCHTALASLTPVFQQNYDGNTPTMVASFATYRLPAVVGPYPIPMAQPFAYNNVDNLLFEVTWESSDKSNVMCRVKTGSVAGHRCSAWDYQAEAGSADAVAYNALIVFDTYPGVAPASFGRLKTLFK